MDDLSHAARLFYGSSMLAAAAGRAGCEVLVVSNLLPCRDGQVAAPYPASSMSGRPAHRR